MDEDLLLATKLLGEEVGRSVTASALLSSVIACELVVQGVLDRDPFIARIQGVLDDIKGLGAGEDDIGYLALKVLRDRVAGTPKPGE